MNGFTAQKQTITPPKVNFDYHVLFSDKKKKKVEEADELDKWFPLWQGKSLWQIVCAN